MVAVVKGDEMLRPSPAVLGPGEERAQGGVRLDRANRCQAQRDGSDCVRGCYALLARAAGVDRHARQLMQVGIGKEPRPRMQQPSHDLRWTCSC